MLVSPTWTAKNPGVAILGFSIPFWQGGLVLRLIAGTIFVEPFADEVGNNTSRNGDQKWENKLHAFTPFPAIYRGGNGEIITFLLLRIYMIHYNIMVISQKLV